jgi:hypothetical protein
MDTDIADSRQPRHSSLSVRLHARLRTAARSLADGADEGQATTEYALIMLGAALVALMVVTWATAGGGAGKIGQLFESVLDSVIRNVT